MCTPARDMFCEVSLGMYTCSRNRLPGIDFHVSHDSSRCQRFLSSRGSRPRLPWCKYSGQQCQLLLSGDRILLARMQLGVEWLTGAVKPTCQKHAHRGQRACIGVPLCTGVEYSSGRCEVWTRPGGIRATKALKGFSCLRYEPPGAFAFSAPDGGFGRACRGADSTDNSASYMVVATAGSLFECKAPGNGTP